MNRTHVPSPKLLSGLRLHFILGCIQSRDSSVRRELGYGLDDRSSRVRFPAGGWNFSLHHRVQNGSGAHQASYPMDTRGSSLGVKRPGREASHSPPSNTEVKGVELHLHSPSTLSWRAADLKKCRDNFTFYLYVLLGSMLKTAMPYKFWLVSDQYHSPFYMMFKSNFSAVLRTHRTKIVI
jgi:hypothetical protein